MAKKPYRYAVLEAVANEMRANPDMCYFYEYQSPVAVSATGTILDLVNEFGAVRTSGKGWALDEAWYVGAATGVAMLGIPVVAELPSMTTTMPLEFVFNQVGNMRMMTGGQVNLPMVLWMDGAGRYGGSAQQHSQVGQEAMYANIPGVKIVVPTNAYDAAGLMTAAIRDPDPVMFFDYREMAAGEQPDMPEGTFEVPIGKATIRQRGTDLTLVAWAPATGDVNKALPEIAKAGISVEYIDPRTLKPLDVATIVTSVRKTGRLLVVEHGYWTNGFSAHVVAEVAQQVDGAKLRRITFPDAAGPAAREMIEWMRPDAPKILEAVKTVASL
jgi:pyruvate dehydrogenase E1 component beta subunit